MPKKTDSPGLEGSLQQLEELVARMESGELSLEQSLAAFEKGVALTGQCQAALSAAQQKVQILLKDKGGEQLADLPSDAAEDGA